MPLANAPSPDSARIQGSIDRTATAPPGAGSRRVARLWRVAAAAALWLFAVSVQAQLLDRVDVSVVGDDALVRIEFNVLIQYLRHVPTSHGTAVRVYFQITGANDQSAGLVEEERRAQPNKLLPRVQVVYPAQLPSVQRYIDVSFDSAVDFRVQPEGNNRLLVYVRLTPEQLEALRGAKPPERPAPSVTAPPSPGPSVSAPPASAPSAPAPPTAAPSTPAPSTPASAPPQAAPTPPVPAAPAPSLALPPPTVLVAPATGVEKQVAADVADARGALAIGDIRKAILALNRALEQPTNAYSPEAQELMGVARERNGETQQAATAYQAYLKLYPDGPGALRVRDRLSALSASAAHPTAVARAPAMPPPTVLTAPATELDKQVGADLADARAALAAKDNGQAIVALNRALNLPPNAYSQEAQELIGIARARNGESAKALAEFELYLKLYPDGPGAARVREQLNALAVPPVPMGGPMPPEGPAAGPALSAWGSVSQYYYGGQSQTTNTRTITTPATDATTLDTAKISATDQSQLVNNVDLTARYRDGDWDSRFVMRDQYVANFLANGSNRNWLNALYAETRYLPTQLMARIGRQSATSGGILGLFDGAVGSWGFLPNYRVNAVVGQPVDNPFNTTSTFYGASLDVDKVGDRFSGSAFAIRQVAAGETDRLGIGGELRYFDTERNVYSMLDYDPLFHAVNIGMVQGTWQFPTLTTINALLDYRRTPTLQLTNALIAYPGMSLSSLIQQQGVDQVRSEAKALTPVTKQALFGVTQQVSAQWQLGLDVRWSSLMGTPPFQSLPSTPATGSVWTYTGQAIGSGLAKLQDILVVNVGVLNGAQLRAQNAGIDYRFVPLSSLTLEPLFAWYHQTDNQGQRLTRLSPGLRASYRIAQRFAIEGQFALERTTTIGNMINDTIERYFYYIGWRWDF